MADDNNKISVDINIDSDGQKQINQYVKSFDSLRDSINNLSKPISSFSGNITSLSNDLLKFTDSILKLNAQNQEFISNGEKINNKISNLSTSFTTWTLVIQTLKNASMAWVSALSGGLTILTAFLPEIIKFTTALFTGKEAINAMTTNFKNLNDVMKASNAQAASQIVQLQVLYKSATDVNNSYANRIKSVKELKQEYPDFLKNMSNEDILNGRAQKTYKQLTQSIIDNARAKAALSKITEVENKLLDADYQIQKIKNANYNEVKRAKTNFEQQPTAYRGGRSDTNLQIAIVESNDRAKEAIQEQEQAKTILKANIDFLMSFAGGADKIAKTFISNNNSNDQSVNTGHQSAAPYTTSQNTQPAIQRAQTEQLQAISVNFAQTIELEKKNYDAKKALLDDTLNKKLISQQRYLVQSQQLEEKYHSVIGTRIDEFNQTDLDKANKHLNDIASSDLHDQVMNDDQKDVNKASMPEAKFTAEKKMISDKYDYEISLATGNANKIMELEDQKQKDITDLTKKYDQERKSFELQSAQQASNAAFSLLQNSIKSQSDAKIKQLETQKTAELNNSSLTSSQKQAIEDKYKKQEAAEKVKAFKDEQKASILQAVINGALAVTKATAQSGVLAPFIIPGIIAETAIQIATIAAQKTPQYAKGGLHYKSDGKGTLLSGYSRTDNMNAHLRSGEAVVVSEAMRDPWARNMVSAINVAYGGRDFSMANPGRGYAIGGIFTDGGNSNRYYNQPMNNQKDLANTIAYQMINNFPPVYVDVKDINNQQNILAQTINRVNL